MNCNNEWGTICSEKLVDEYHVSVLKNKVKLPDGTVIEDFYTVRIPDASMVCALTPDRKVILKSEYRYACGEEVIECPAGMFEANESDSLAVAKRELLEETGFSSDNWTYLDPSWESTSKLTNRMHLFLARDCVSVCDQHLEKNEHLDLRLVSLYEALCLQRA